MPSKYSMMPCAECGALIPDRPDRKSKLCRQCCRKRRCEKCGKIVPDSGVHECASIDLRPTRYCSECGRALRNQGFERWTTKCASCSKKVWRDKEREKRAELRLALGGKCAHCGYSRCQAALHFHHINGREDGTISGKVDLAEVRDHPERFELLCANCHIETHNCAEESPIQSRSGYDGPRGAKADLH